MLHEALTAAERLGDRLQVVNMPWLNRFDVDWLSGLVDSFDDVFVLEDHAPVGGLGDALRRNLGARSLNVFGVDGWPAGGTPTEALRSHRLDGASLAERIAATISVKASAG
jgi:transketolase